MPFLKALFSCFVIPATKVNIASLKHIPPPVFDENSVTMGISVVYRYINSPTRDGIAVLINKYSFGHSMKQALSKITI